MKKLLSILAISLSILLGLIAYDIWLESDFDEISDGSNLVQVEPIAIPTLDVSKIPTPSPTPAPNVESEEVEVDSDSEIEYEEIDESEKIEHKGYEYAYNHISDAQREVYDVIYPAIVDYKAGVKLPTTDMKVVDKAYSAVLNDHPEIFYVDGYKYTEYTRGDRIVGISFSGAYTYSKMERDSVWKSLDAAANSIVAGAPGGDDYLKVKYVFETIVNDTEYNLNAPDNQNIVSVLLKHSSVCQGYAKTAQLLLNRMNVPTTLITGSVASGEGHAWNVVCSNGKWYYLDTTWGDSSYTAGGGGDAAVTGINYDYLLSNEDDMRGTHYPDMSYDMPVCNSLDDNYFVREGFYFTEFNNGYIQGAFDRTINAGAPMVKIKASDAAAYANIKNELLNNQKVFGYLNGSKQIRYSENDNARTLTFWL